MAEAATLSTRLRDTLLDQYQRYRDLLVAIFIVGTLAVMLLPLPSTALDFLLAISLMVSIVLLLTTLYVPKPLDFSTFPSVLLMVTLYRLSLNIASTRLILGNAHERGLYAAGAIIATFGQFVGGQNIAIGITIFAIITIIQFVVITKGASRIAEVAARFTLDGMPGLQMAIDADLNAGLIDEREARRRREEVRQLADFYGAMDGASKFVRGDAIAGIIIIIINIFIGLVIGTIMHGMSLAEAGRVFTTLTIGDGLVSQMPALLVSVSSGLLVTRSAGRAEFGPEVMHQVFGHRKVMAVAAVLMAFLGLSGVFGTPFPPVPLLCVAAIAGTAWYLMARGAAAVEAAERQKAEEKAREEKKPAAPEKMDAYLRIDPMELEIGYTLVPMVDPGHGGGLLQRIAMIRQRLATEIGIVVPPIRIRDNIELEPNEYVIRIHGAPVARGTIEPDRYLAMNSGMASERLDGIETTEPAFGLPATWITADNREDAERLGYTVVDAETVLATHLTEVIKQRAHELLTREEVRKLLDGVKEYAPNLVQDVVPDLLTAADVQKVLQNLLRERVSIRNLPAILEVLGDIGRRTKDPEILTEYARNALARWLCNEYSEKKKLHVVTLDPRLEDVIQQHVDHTEGGSFLSLRPASVQKIVEAIAREVQRQLQAGHAALVLTSPQIRLQVKRMTEPTLPMLAVMSYNEVLPEYEVESIGMVSVDLTAP